MDIWEATTKQINQVTQKLYGKDTVAILKQNNIRAKVYFKDGTVKTIYSWDFEAIPAPDCVINQMFIDSMDAELDRRKYCKEKSLQMY